MFMPSFKLGSFLTFASLTATPAIAQVSVDGAAVDARLAALEQRVATVERVTGVEPAAAPTQVVGGPAPLGVHLDAVDAIDVTRLGETRVSWDFGDAGARRNVLAGFNAAHVYDKPGRYTITRTIEGPGDVPRQVKRYVVDVVPDGRRPIHVAADGDDARDGTTPERAVRTVARAQQLMGRTGNVALLFRRGDRFAVERSIDVRGPDVRIADYGDGSRPLPVLVVDVARSPSIMIVVAQGPRLLVERVAFDSTNEPEPFGQAKMPHAINAGSAGLVLRQCRIDNVGYTVNGNGRPEGVLIADCDSPSPTGLRAYLAWVEGSGWTILDNHVVNSTREHCIRIGNGEGVNIQGNRLSNLDRRPAEGVVRPGGNDPTDFSKSTLNIQRGRIAYVAGNVLRDGPVSVGPLGGADGRGIAEGRWIGAVFEDNRLLGIPLEVRHGAEHITLRNNLVYRDDNPAFQVFAYDEDFKRGVVDVTIEQNTAVNAGTRGGFLTCGAGAREVTLVGNFYAAPRLIAGPYDAAVVIVNAPDLSSFTRIDRNRWPQPQSTRVAKSGVNYVSAKPGSPEGYYDAAAWAKVAPGDTITPVTSTDVLSRDGAGVDVSRLPPVDATPVVEDPAIGNASPGGTAHGATDR